VLPTSTSDTTTELPTTVIDTTTESINYSSG
jgi:hypothetical protein